MMTQFYFVLTNVEAEPLLKEEISIRYPELRMSYSRPGFITFKAEKDIIFNPLFCRVSGLSQGKFSKSELKLEKAWVYSISDKFTVPADLKALSDRTLFKIGETVNLVVMAGEDEFWLGTYTLRRDHLQTPGEVSSILERDDVPSRAYYKLAEAFEAFDLPMEHEDRVLELGSAPGGATLFLLEQDMKVLGVDPAEMDPKVAKKYNFKHLKKPFEYLTVDDVSEVEWIVSDVNLPPTVVLKEVWRLLTFLEPIGMILTLKINEHKHLEFVATIRQKMRDNGFKKVELKYLPSHKKEIALIVQRD